MIILERDGTVSYPASRASTGYVKTVPDPEQNHDLPSPQPGPVARLVRLIWQIIRWPVPAYHSDGLVASGTRHQASI